MFKMLAQLWASMTVFFAALEKLANGANHLATWAEESAGSFADEARLDRQNRLAKLQRSAPSTPTTSTAATTKRKLAKA